MKNRLKRIKYNGGFTLTEVLVALLIFSIMMLMVIQMLAFSMQLRMRNIQTANSIDEQSEILAASHGVDFDTVLAEMGTVFWSGAPAHTIVFRDASGAALSQPICVNVNAGNPCSHTTGPCATTNVVVQISGDVAGYFKDDEFTRLTSPRFNPSFHGAAGASEFDLILRYTTTYRHPSDSRFYSNRSNIIPTIREDNVGSVCTDINCDRFLSFPLVPASCTGHTQATNVEWTFDLSYPIVAVEDDTSFVTFFELPTGADNIIVDSGARNARAHVIRTNTSTPARTGVRIMNLEGTFARVKVSFTLPAWGDITARSLFRHFNFENIGTGSAVINLAPISSLDITFYTMYEDPPSNNFRNNLAVAAGTTWPERPCARHSAFPCPGDPCRLHRTNPCTASPPCVIVRCEY